MNATLDSAVAQAAFSSEQLFTRLRARWPEGGVARDTFGAGEQYAHDLIHAEGRLLGLQCHTDFAGNLWMTLAGRDRSLPIWITGSHLDSVPQGGNFDGAAGVVAGLTVLKAIRETGTQPLRDIALAAFRAEEASSWYQGDFNSHIGSRAALGMLDPAELHRARHLHDGATLYDRMRQWGAQPEKVVLGHGVIDPRRCHGFLELHIEQGPVLFQRRLPVGVVTAIRGSSRARQARAIGEDSHSGAVPHEYRRDAVLAVVELCHRLDQAWEQLRADQQDLVYTVGKLFTDPDRHSITKVPGRVDFSIDLRSQQSEVLDQMEALARRLAGEIGVRRRVDIELGHFNRSAPAAMNPALIASLEFACSALGVEGARLPCGAGHDAGDFASAGIPTGMIFVRNDRGSHNPEESMAIEDFVEGTRVLAWQLMQ